MGRKVAALGFLFKEVKKEAQLGAAPTLTVSASSVVATGFLLWRQEVKVSTGAS